ncbi:TetR/AcrR family transcriptional regulator [Nonomuraea fuscirosea]
MATVLEQIAARLPEQPGNVTVRELRRQLPFTVSPDYLRKTLQRLVQEGVAVKSELADAAQAPAGGSRERARFAYSLVQREPGGDGLAGGRVAAQRVWAGNRAGQRQDDRVTALIEAGFELFGRQGFAATGVQKLVRRARCSLRAYYTLYGTKERLLAAVVDRCAADLTEEARKRLTRSRADWLSQMRVVIAAYVEMVVADDRLAKIMHRERHHLNGGCARDHPLLTVAAAAAADGLGTAQGEAEMKLILEAITGAVDALVNQRHQGADLPTGRIIDVTGKVLCAMLDMPVVGGRGLRARAGT